jgi:hypothetical protein
MVQFKEDAEVELMYVFSAKSAHDEPQGRELSVDGGQDAS